MRSPGHISKNRREEPYLDQSQLKAAGAVQTSELDSFTSRGFKVSIELERPSSLSTWLHQPAEPNYLCVYKKKKKALTYE